MFDVRRYILPPQHRGYCRWEIPVLIACPDRKASRLVTVRY